MNYFRKPLFFYDNLDEMICSLPPYKDMDLRRNRLYDLLNKDIALWEWDEEFEENEVDYLEHFNTDYPLNKRDYADTIDYILQFNDKLKAVTNEYVTFIEDLLRVKKTYELFLEMLHNQSRYLDNSETAAVVNDFILTTRSKFETYNKLQPSGNMQLSYTVLEQKKSSILCEQYLLNKL